MKIDGDQKLFGDKHYWKCILLCKKKKKFIYTGLEQIEGE